MNPAEEVVIGGDPSASAEAVVMELVRGNILKAKTTAIVNPINCQGAMGAGLALQFRNTFPDNYRAYRLACVSKEIESGRMFVFERENPEDGPRIIVNFPTKVHWRDKSRLEDIRIGLDALVEEVQRLGIRSIAIPPLGCGLGGLEWSEVKPLIFDAFSRCAVDVRVLVYEP